MILIVEVLLSCVAVEHSFNITFQAAVRDKASSERSTSGF